MLRPSRKQRSNGRHNESQKSSHHAFIDDDASGKKKAFLSNSTMGFAFIAVLLLTVLVNYQSSSRTHHYRRINSVMDVIPYKSIDELSNTDVSETTQQHRIRNLLLTPQQDEELEINKDGIGSHLVFSTDCSSYQHWQSYLVFYSALRVKQPGHVTRIVSGCNPEQSQQMMDWFQKHIQHMSPKRFHVHLTPHFSKTATGGDYKFYNKPFGLQHWLQHSEELMKKKNDDDLVILIDPDMVLLRPITGDFSNPSETIVSKRRAQHKPFDSMVVQHGKPFAQTYGMGTQWMKFNLTKIAGPDSPSLKVQQLEAGMWYPAGPPYIATLQDMDKIANAWVEFVPKVHEEYPHLLGEMFAYCIAAAHLELPHKLIDSLMVSNSNVGGEAWELVDRIGNDQVCKVAATAGASQHSNNNTSRPLPSVIHYCQRYAVGDDWFFAKRRIPHDVFSCPHALLREPPSDLATRYDYKKPPGQTERTYFQKPELVGREAFCVCGMTAILNEAATFYKHFACSSGETANLKKTFVLK